MIYLSQIELNPRSRQVQAELRDPYQMHRTLSKAFGDDPALWTEARCLFRIDSESASEHPRVLVQSRVCPNWDRLSVRGDYAASDPRTKEFAPLFTAGQSLAFRLRANPTVKKDGKRRALLREEEQMDWLNRKAGLGGFHVYSTRVLAQPCLMSRTASDCTATLHAVQYDGLLRVNNLELFLSTLENGIGSGKGFGFGLLSVARG